MEGGFNKFGDYKNNKIKTTGLDSGELFPDKGKQSFLGSLYTLAGVTLSRYPKLLSRIEILENTSEKLTQRQPKGFSDIALEQITEEAQRKVSASLNAEGKMTEPIDLEDYVQERVTFWAIFGGLEQPKLLREVYIKALAAVGIQY